MLVRASVPAIPHSFSMIRLLVFVIFAFLAGVLMERHRTAEACITAGGKVQKGICIGAFP